MKTIPINEIPKGIRTQSEYRKFLDAALLMKHNRAVVVEIKGKTWTTVNMGVRSVKARDPKYRKLRIVTRKTMVYIVKEK